jgi:hypothetical protein
MQLQEPRYLLRARNSRADAERGEAARARRRRQSQRRLNHRPSVQHLTRAIPRQSQVGTGVRGTPIACRHRQRHRYRPRVLDPDALANRVTRTHGSDIDGGAG